jgi:hypothetical protein
VPQFLFLGFFFCCCFLFCLSGENQTQGFVHAITLSQNYIFSLCASVSSVSLKVNVWGYNKITPFPSFTEMLQFVSNQVGEFPDLFSEQLCSSFPGGGGSSSSSGGSGGGGSSGNSNSSSNGSSNGRGNSSGAVDPSIQRSFNQVPLSSFSPSAASPQAPALQVKVPPAAVPTPPRTTPVLQPRPQPQPQPPAQLQQQTVMITPTFSTAPQTRIIQQPLIYQNAATSFQGDSKVRPRTVCLFQGLCA